MRAFKQTSAPVQRSRRHKSPPHSVLLVSAFWKLFPFRSKQIQLAERKQKAFGKAAGNEWGGAFAETWERVQRLDLEVMQWLKDRAGGQVNRRDEVPHGEQG